MGTKSGNAGSARISSQRPKRISTSSGIAMKPSAKGLALKNSSGMSATIARIVFRARALCPVIMAP